MTIEERLRWSLTKLLMRAAEDQAKTACGDLQIYAIPEDGIEGATHAIGKRWIERVKRRRNEEDDGTAEGE